MTNPAPLTLLLIRHGQPQGRQADGLYLPSTQLTSLGHQQADATATALTAKNPPTMIYTSPYRRALQTAEPLATHLNLQMTQDSRLAEIEVSLEIARGIQQGVVWPLWQPHHRAAESGETLADFTTRIGAFWQEIAQRHDGERIAVVAHGGVINEFLRWSLGFDATKPWHFFFDLPYASITEIAFWPNGPAQNHAPWYSAIWRVGDTTHLRNL